MRVSFAVGSLALFLVATGCLDLDTTNGSSTSSGGSSSTSSGGGMAGVIQEWEATEPMGTTGYVLPAWLQIECGTSNRTSQWAADKLVRGFGSNAARPRNVGMGWGLSVESRRRNQIQNSDSWSGSSWTDPVVEPIMPKTLGQLDPAGGMTATQFNSSGKETSAHAAIPMGYASAWLKGAGSDPAGHVVVDNGGLAWTYQAIGTSTIWSRYSVGIGDGSLFLTTAPNNVVGVPEIKVPTVIHAFGAQHETDGNGNTMKYPSSYIPTTDKDVIRDADSLYSKSAQEILPGGYFHVIVRVALNYARDEGFSNFHHLLFINSTNNLRIDLTNKKVTLVGVSNTLSGPTSGALDWDREQEIRIEAQVTPTGRMLSVSGAKAGNFTISDMENKPWPENGTVWILGDTSGSEECADLRYIGFFKPN